MNIWTGLGMGQEPEWQQVWPIQEQKKDIQDLTHELQRLKLLNQALWEMLREQMGWSDEQLEQKALEIDLRDGVQDGRISDAALRCPQCGRTSSSRHWRCLYCGLEFEKPVMG